MNQANVSFADKHERGCLLWFLAFIGNGHNVYSIRSLSVRYTCFHIIQFDGTHTSAHDQRKHLGPRNSFFITLAAHKTGAQIVTYRMIRLFVVAAMYRCRTTHGAHTRAPQFRSAWQHFSVPRRQLLIEINRILHNIIGPILAHGIWLALGVFNFSHFTNKTAFGWAKSALFPDTNRTCFSHAVLCSLCSK